MQPFHDGASRARQSPRTWRWAVTLLIFIAAFTLRATRPISNPEVWSDRAFHFSSAVLAGDWKNTYRRYHPGVTIMWLSGAGLKFFAEQNGGLTADQMLGVAPTRPGTLPGALQAGMIPLALAIAAAIAAGYPLMSRLAGHKIGLVASSLMVLDPFHLTYSRVLHPEALLASLMYLSTLFLLVYLHEQESKYLIASGCLAGLALLTKTPALFLLPYTGLIAGWWQAGRWWRRRDSTLPLSWRTLVRSVVWIVIAWLIVAALTFVLVWPAMWVRPIGVLSRMVEHLFIHTTSTDKIDIYFNGINASRDPGVIYYLATMAWKTSLVSLPLIGLGSLFALVRVRQWQSRLLWATVLYACFFTMQMGISQSKIMAYILPVFPALNVIAAFGLVWGAEATGRLIPRHAGGAISGSLIAAALGIQALIILPRYPYYGTHFNLLLGGARAAQKVLPLQDQGEGLDLAAAFLNGLPHGQDKTAMIRKRSSPVFKRVFSGRTVTDVTPWATYRVYDLNQVMREFKGHEDWRVAWQDDQKHTPLYTVSFDGVVYVWVYGDRPEDPAPDGPRFALDHRLNGQIHLREARLNGDTFRPGEELILVLTWESEGLITSSYTVFSHLMDEDGNIVAQQDNIPLHGIRPTQTWRLGERLEDTYLINLEEGLEAGRYELSVGMYDSASLARLPIMDQNGLRQPEDRLLIGQINIIPPA